jgi:hypothetical protein
MWLLCLFLLLSALDQKTPDVQTPTEVQTTPEEDSLDQLIKVRRIFVDTLTGGDSALKIRDLLMSKLQGSKLFIITEDEERADAVLKGAGEDTVFTDLFQSSDNINAHTQLSTPGTQSISTPSGSRQSGRGFAGGLSIGENESRRTEERKHEAIVTVRLVNKDGDVIWSTTQESFGGKFMGASADVADKVTRRLVADYNKAKKQTQP